MSMSVPARSVPGMDRLQVIDTEARRFADALAGTDPAAAVPTCPDWDARALLWHLTGVHRFWADVLGQDPQTDEEIEALDWEGRTPPESVEELLGLREQATADLLDQLRALDDDTARWTWSDDDQTVGFTRRIQTYEATMHRVDAELTAGHEISPIAADVAAGAVDHCVDVMWGLVPDWAKQESLAVVELRADDTGQRWLVEIRRWFGVGPESGNSYDLAFTGRVEGAAPQATVTAVTAEQLARWAWGRQPGPGAIAVEGSDAGRDAVERLIGQGIP